MSFLSDIMQPGGGVMLIPFVRAVVAVLLCCCVAGAIMDVARIHMAVLSFLGTGLLFSLGLFEKEFNKVHGRGSSSSSSSSGKVPASSNAQSEEKSD